jgi:hypothetical protein
MVRLPVFHSIEVMRPLPNRDFNAMANEDHPSTTPMCQLLLTARRTRGTVGAGRLKDSILPRTERLHLSPRYPSKQYSGRLIYAMAYH